MKTKFLLSVATLAFLAACNDSSSSPTDADQTPTETPSVNTPVVDSTNTNNPAVDSTAQNGLNQGQNAVDSTQIDKPVDNPNNPVAQDSTPPIPADTVSPAPVDTTVPPAIDPNLKITMVDPSESVAACRSASRAPIAEPIYAAQTQGDTIVYYGAELAGKEQFKYGRFEACMKMVSIPGSVSSMFLYYDDSWRYDEEPWNEIDIEVIGKSDTSWQSNIITREGDESITKNTSSESVHPSGFKMSEDFHLYAIVWTPEFVSWEIDGVEIRRDTVGGKLRGKHADADQVAFLTETETLRFNLWIAKTAAWVGKFTGDELIDAPKAQWIDYVRVYSYDVTTKTFTQNWQEDFDGTELSDRWSTGSHVMENVKLTADNVVVENGYCKLLLTRKAENK